MTSTRPYLLRALYEWILDNHMTPHLLVDATQPDTLVPGHLVQDGRIILNISPTAVRDLVLGNSVLTCNARFQGIPMDIQVPVMAVLGIYARENGHGMLFPEEREASSPEAEEGTPPQEDPKPPRGRPSLKVIK